MFTSVKQVSTNAALTRQLHNNRSTQIIKQSMQRRETKRQFENFLQVSEQQMQG